VHERSLAVALVRAAEEAARLQGARSVLVVRARMPALGPASPEHLRLHFELAAEGTVAEGARLEVAGETEGTDLVLESIEIEE
jgi:hydrogenase nickel incorporation protein HypA/HybF